MHFVSLSFRRKEVRLFRKADVVIYKKTRALEELCVSGFGCCFCY